MFDLSLNDYITLIGNFGFPLVLAFYLLFRMEKKIESLTAAIIEMQKALEKENKDENNEK